MSKNYKSRDTHPYPDSNLCPCGSGEIYKKCCKKKKKLKYFLDKRGRVFKRVEFHPRLEPTIKEAAVEFREMFGRKPGNRDPIVFNHRLSGEADFWQQAEEVGRIAGTPEQLIFAWRRSGFIVGEHSREIMSDNEYDEWADAIDEYFTIKEDGFDPYHVFTNLSATEYEKYKSLIDKFDQIIIALGFALTSPKKFVDDAEYFRYLFVQRSLGSLRTIKEMYNKRYNGDCLSITRALYEAYLRMKLLRLDHTSAKRFEAALSYQVGVYKPKIKKNGKPNFDVVIDPETGDEFLIAISNKEVIEISDFPLEQQFYHDLYPLLSGFVHPDLLQVAMKSINSSKEEGHYDDPIHASIFVATVCVLLLLEIEQSRFLRKITKRDIRHVVKSVSRSLFELIICDSIIGRGVAPPSIYRFFGLEIQPVAEPQQQQQE